MRISQFPKGFVGLLGVQDAGRSPADLAEVVNGVVDFTPLYLATTQIASVSSGNSPWVVGAQDIVATVPQNETWVMKGVHLRGSAAAAAPMRFSAHARLAPGAAPRLPIASSMSLGSAVAENASMSIIYPTLVLLPGGTEIIVTHDLAVAGGGNAYFISFLYTPLRQSV